MDRWNDENAPLDYTAAPSLREGEVRLRSQKRRDAVLFPHTARPAVQEDYGIPENPFQKEPEAAATGVPISEPRRRIRPVASAAAGVQTEAAPKAKEVSQFIAPKTLEIPDWYRTSQGNPLPPDARTHPRVVAAETVQGEEAKLSGRPTRSYIAADGYAVSGTARDYALAGYPLEMVEEARQQQYEEAAIQRRRTHGAGQVRSSRNAHTAFPGQSLSENKPSPAASPAWHYETEAVPVRRWSAEQEAEQPPVPESVPIAAVESNPAGEAMQPVRPVRPRAGETESKPRFSFLSLLSFFSAIALFAGIAFAGFSYGKGFEIKQKINAVYAEREATAQTLKDNHPIRYRELITSKADQYGIAPAFVASIILNESSYNPQAVSSVGARGLMQLMDDTAEWIWNKLKPEGSYSFDLLFGEDLNVEFGCWYLKYLSGLFRGDPILVAAAFHAGQGEIKNWLANKDYSSDGIHIPVDKMPDGPTKTYVKRILRDYAVYKDFYNANEV